MRHTVECECCLQRRTYGSERVARLAYSFHEDHHGSRLVLGEDGGKP